MLRTLALILLFTFINIDAQFIQGTYEGEALGRKDAEHSGIITVRVSLSDDRIENIDVTEFDQNTDHKKYGLHVTEALERIPKRIINSQSVFVDAVSMATATSQAIELAVARAIYKGLKKDYLSGIYRSTVTGWRSKKFRGNIEVEVELSDETIKKIKVVKFEQDTLHKKYGSLAENAREMIPEEVIKNQNLEVDAVSGATMSSNAILLAVSKSLKRALKDGQKEKRN